MSDEPSGECPPEWKDYYETRLNNSSNEFLTRSQHANAELAALRAKLLRVQEKLDGTIKERDVIAVECAARGDEVRRLDAVILEGRTIIYNSAFYYETTEGHYRYPMVRAWVVSAIPVREDRAPKEAKP